MLPAHKRQSAVHSLPRRSNAASEIELQRAEETELLAELFDLLEDYAPQWYTREHHERAESALRLEQAEQAGVVAELYDLLERYAPRWYTQKQRERIESTLRRVNES